MQEVKITAIAFGGQGMGVLDSGKKVFVWNAIPQETVHAEVYKKKSSWAEAIATEVILPSTHRIAPKEPDMYLSTSPWQIIEYSQESRLKQHLLEEAFFHVPATIPWQPFYQHPTQDYGYRNKMEYNFWWDNNTGQVSLALHRRGSHQKISVTGSALANDELNAAGRRLIDFINTNRIEARPLKSVIIRSDATGRVGMSLFINNQNIAKALRPFKDQVHSFEIIYSNPKSPASVATEVLFTDDMLLTDTLLGMDFVYTTRSFFQVNVPVYEAVLKKMAEFIARDPAMDVLELYSGVGSIGLSVVPAGQRLTMVETSQESTAQAARNALGRANCTIITEDAEKVTDYIAPEQVVIIDPPRAGMHTDVTNVLCAQRPKTILYLSCNPTTQARDVEPLLKAGYSIDYAQGYNFFPRTPHIESLLVLQRRD